MKNPITARRIVYSVHALLWACTLLTACASLPQVSYLKGTLDAPAAPTISGAQGTLAAKKANAIFARRGRNSSIDLKSLAALEEAATGVPLISGNKVTLLHDGPQTMNAMLAAITTARQHINLETYIFDQDELGLRFADLLIAKQRAGIAVSIIYDGVGTLGTPPEFFDRMRAAGIRLVAFNPVNPFARFGRWKINNRDHRKILVVDGSIGFTGGVNISKDYSRGSLFRSRAKSNTQPGWRDTHVQIEGPAVAALQLLFMDTWIKQNGPDLPDVDYFPQLAEAGDKVVRILGSDPGGDFEIYKAYILAMQEAQQTIHITSAYFVPDAQVVDALIRAARRGVDVRIILPGVSDHGLVIRAAQSYYDQLLAGGVKIHELQVAVLHAKTAVIDGVWSTVGSTNIDTRSFLHNNEVNVIVLDTQFAAAMENAFLEDLRNALEIKAENWGARPLVDRIKEWTARSLEYWL